MTDNAYNMQRIQVRAGETIRFVAVNRGQFLHEFSFAPAAVHAAHRPEMAMMMEHGMITPERVVSLNMSMPGGHSMSHTAPNTVLVEPGKTGEISWRFNRAGTIEVACNIPGHYETGMRADLVVTGEGRMDAQSVHGKTPIGVAHTAKAFGKPVIAIVGCLREDYEVVYAQGIDAVFPIIRQLGSLEEILQHGRDNLVSAAQNVARIYQMGISRK